MFPYQDLSCICPDSGQNLICTAGLPPKRGDPPETQPLGKSSRGEISAGRSAAISPPPGGPPPVPRLHDDEAGDLLPAAEGEAHLRPARGGGFFEGLRLRTTETSDHPLVVTAFPRGGARGSRGPRGESSRLESARVCQSLLGDFLFRSTRCRSMPNKTHYNNTMCHLFLLRQYKIRNDKT